VNKLTGYEIPRSRARQIYWCQINMLTE